MSTFGGKIQEVPGICVDRFDCVDDCEAYFLSHCHQDHTVGLFPNINQDFLRHILGNESVYVYCSEVSLEILKRRQGNVKGKIKSVSVTVPTVIKIKNGYLSVTTVPAGHCPGSVMFLFEIGDKTVLYTGDFRINPSDLSKVKTFYNSSGKLKKIDSVYLDTTFFFPSYENFSNRSETVENLAEIIKDWISRSDNHVIAIDTPATYGSENFFIQVSKKIKMPIHVTPEKYNFYKCIPEMDSAITTDGDCTRLHSSCHPTDYRFICKVKNENVQIKSVKPSALIWDQNFLKRNNGAWIKEDGNVVRVCYSCHASYSELCGLLDFLKPLDIVPCVVPEEPERKQELYDLLAKHKRFDVGVHDGKNSSRKKICINIEEKCDLQNNKDVAELLESPPILRKKLNVE